MMDMPLILVAVVFVILVVGSLAFMRVMTPQRDAPPSELLQKRIDAGQRIRQQQAN